MDRRQHIQDLLRPAVETMECELWGVEYHSKGTHATLRVFIDKADGVSVEDCERVSRQVSALLDVEDPIDSAYQLEVSSPGMDCLLFERTHFEKFLGEKVKIRLKLNFDGRRNYSGALVGLEGDEIVVNVDNEEFLFPLESIDRAQVVPTF